MLTESRYIDGNYLSQNPEWDRKDSPWKASKVFSILLKNKIQTNSICEVGCGSGGYFGTFKKIFSFSKYDRL